MENIVIIIMIKHLQRNQILAQNNLYQVDMFKGWSKNSKPHQAERAIAEHFYCGNIL